jgi:hypothetical protein
MLLIVTKRKFISVLFLELLLSWLKAASGVKWWIRDSVTEPKRGINCAKHVVTVAFYYKTGFTLFMTMGKKYHLTSNRRGSLEENSN